jgi:hypothetical protein
VWVEGAGANAYDADDSVNLDDGIWYDAVIVTYRWNPYGGGATQVAYDVAGPAAPLNVMSVMRDDTPYPGPGEAAARLGKVSKLGRVISGTARANYQAGPRGAASWHSSPTDNLTGSIAAVRWTFPDGAMAVRTRDMI